MNVEFVSTENVIPYAHNNRTHLESQVDRIVKSIDEFGFNQPIVLDSDNVVLVGHGRLLAAQKMDLKEIPCVKLINLTDEQKRLYRILDNKLQNDSTWDLESLESELAFLQESDIDITSWGLGDLSNLIGDVTSNDIDAEWEGMPSYESEDCEALQTIKVHFMTREAVQEFAKLIKQSLTDKTKSVWFPEVPPMDLKSSRIVDDI